MAEVTCESSTHRFQVSVSAGKGESPVRKKPVRKLLVACITGALFLPKTGFTLGLGEIEVNSALNQELKADIELYSAEPEDAETLIVKLASREEFSRAGLDRPFLLNDLRFKTVVVNGTPHIQVTTIKPVREPFLNFLLEVDWPKGHLLREYTVLLDPPAFMSSTQAAPVQTSTDNNAGFRPAAASRPASRAVTPQVTLIPASANNSQPRAAAPVVQSPVVQNTVSADRYRIQSGDTAWSLANSMRPNSSVTVEQMMMALLQANPESFIHENINGIKRGYILRRPDLETINAISPAQARAMVKEQAALWREYRQNYSGSSPVSVVDGASGTAAGGTADSQMSGDKGAHLQIVSAGTGTSTSSLKDPTEMSASELREALAIAREKLETERVEKELLHEEVDMLERQVSKMKGLLAVEGGELADVQALASDGEAAPSDMGSDIATDDANVAETTDDMQAAEETATPGTAVSEQDADGNVIEQEATDEQVFVDEADSDTSAEETQEPAPVAETTPVTPSPVVPAGTLNRGATDPLTRLMNDPMLLGAAGGGLLLLLALAYLIVKRRKAAAEDKSAEAASTSLEDIADMVEEDKQKEVETEVVEAADSEETLDTESTMIMEAVDTEDTVVTEAFDDIVEDEEEPRDDVIAEADVYLAYGIYQQAEDLLENAIKENPDRDDYRMKLAETRYASKNQDGFIEVATELKQRHPDADSPTWKKVAAMGLDLCPDHALFQGSAVDDVDVETLATPSPVPMDFDLGDEEEELAVPDLDLSLDEDDAVLDLSSDLDADIAETGDDNDGDSEEIIDISTDELEFDLSETDDEEATQPEDEKDDAQTEDEFSLDIDASELDIDDAMSESAASQGEEATGTDELDAEANEDETSQVAEDEPDSESTMQMDSSEAGLDLETDITLDDEEGNADEAADAFAETQVNDLDIDFGMEEESATDEAATQEAAAEEAEPDVSDEAEIEIDISADDDSLDIDFGLDEEATEADAESSEIEPETSAADNQADDRFEEEDEFDLSNLDDVDEISTKLDLARAYLDMGDSEGTRDILNEVIADGSDEQKKEAEELLSQLDE